MSIFCFAGKFITVGWGKKETQFHGSEGKQAAQKKTQVAVQLQKRVHSQTEMCQELLKLNEKGCE